MDIHPTLPMIMVGTKYGNIHLFDIRDPAMCVSYRAHNDSVSKVGFHPWFNTVISTGYDGSLRSWCLRERTLIHQYNVGDEGREIIDRILVHHALMILVYSFRFAGRMDV